MRSHFQINGGSQRRTDLLAHIIYLFVGIQFEIPTYECRGSVAATEQLINESQFKKISET